MILERLMVMLDRPKKRWRLTKIFIGSLMLILISIDWFRRDRMWEAS